MKRRTLGLTIAGTIALLAGALIASMHSHPHPEYAIENGARTALGALIAAEDRFYQHNGRYLAVPAGPQGAIARGVLGWCTAGCSECELAVEASSDAFTAEARCSLEGENAHYLGYVRVAPGSHAGLVGAFGRCKDNGVFAGDRTLVNTIGPCEQGSWRTLHVASGSKRRLVVQTIPSGASVSANGIELGVTAAGHTALTPAYGIYFWAEPDQGTIAVSVSKEGYNPVHFTATWDSYTYEAVIVLRERLGGR